MLDCKICDDAPPVFFAIQYGYDRVILTHPDNLPVLREMAGPLLMEYPAERSAKQLEGMMIKLMPPKILW